MGEMSAITHNWPPTETSTTFAPCICGQTTAEFCKATWHTPAPPREPPFLNNRHARRKRQALARHATPSIPAR